MTTETRTAHSRRRDAMHAHHDACVAFWYEYHDRSFLEEKPRGRLDALRRKHGLTHDEAAKLATMSHPPSRPRIDHETTRGAA